MGLRWGFKAEANGYAVEVRRELGLPAHSPLCPWKVAALLDFDVFALSDFEQHCPAAVTYFDKRGRHELSGITLPNSTGKPWIVIYNDSHEPGRQAANIMHECAHGLLNHPLPSLIDGGRRRYYDPQIEEEANWLGPALLVSDAAALTIARRKHNLQKAADLYGVSQDLMRFRLNVTGAYRRVARGVVAA